MNLFNEVWSELLEIINGMPLAVKVGWPVFLAWSVAQVVWFRRARVIPAMPLKPASPVRKTQSAPRIRPAVASRRAGGSPEFLAALGLDADERAARAQGPGSNLHESSSSGSIYR